MSVLINCLLIDLYATFLHLSIIVLVRVVSLWSLKSMFKAKPISTYSNLSTSHEAICLFSKEECPLCLILYPHLLSAFASIKLYMHSPVLSRIAWMLTFTELVELSDNIVQVLSVVVTEHDSELSLHFLEIDKSSEERRQNVILAFTEELLYK